MAVESGTLLEIIDQRDTFRGICISCKCGVDGHGVVIADVYEDCFELPLLPLLLRTSIDLFILRPGNKGKKCAEILPLNNQPGLVHETLYIKLQEHFGQGLLDKTPRRTKQKRKFDEVSLSPQKESLEALFQKEVEDSSCKKEDSHD